MFYISILREKSKKRVQQEPEGEFQEVVMGWGEKQMRNLRICSRDYKEETWG